MARRLIYMLVILALAGAAAACGKKGNLEAPEGARPDAERLPEHFDEHYYRK